MIYQICHKSIVVLGNNPELKPFTEKEEVTTFLKQFNLDEAILDQIIHEGDSKAVPDAWDNGKKLDKIAGYILAGNLVITQRHNPPKVESSTPESAMSDIGNRPITLGPGDSSTDRDTNNVSGKVDYGSTDLSQAAIEYAKNEKIVGARNVAVFEYVDLDGSVKTLAKASERGKGHSEKLIALELKNRGIPNENVTRIYSELEPCSAPGGYCKGMIEQGSKNSELGPFENAKVTYSIEYGGTPHDPAKAAKGIEELRRLRSLNNGGKSS